MQIIFHSKSDTEARITITIEAADYRERIINVLKSLGPKTQIAEDSVTPNSLADFEQSYGDDVNRVVALALAAEVLPEYIAAKKIPIVGDPVLVEHPQKLQWRQEKIFHFDYDIGVIPPFTCPPLTKSIKVTGYQIASVSEAAIDEQIRFFQRIHGQSRPADESQAGDTLHGSLLYPAKKISGHIKIDIPSDTTAPHLMGVKASEQITFELEELLSGKLHSRMPKELHEALVGETGKVLFEVAEISRPQPAALDASLFKKVLKTDVVQTVEGFREAIRDSMLYQHQQAAEGHLNHAISEALLAQASIVLPEDFLKAKLLEEKIVADDKELAATYPRHAHGFRWMLLSDQLYEEYDIDPTFEEMVKRTASVLLKGMLLYQGPRIDQAEAEALIQDYLESLEEEEYQKMHDKARLEVLLDLVKEKITIEKKPISVEDFTALMRGGLLEQPLNVTSTASL